MDKKKLGKGLFLILIFLAALILMSPLSGNNFPSAVFLTETGEVEVVVEVADAPDERQKGLMFRSSLEGGMLFIFESEQPLNFWMKNTLIPLDMIFISKELEVVKILSAIPCEADPCPFYSSKEPALYVVEANQGFAQKSGIGIGDKVKFQGIL